MRGIAKQIPILAAVFAALLLILVPHMAHAQVAGITQGTAVGSPLLPLATPPGDVTSNNCATMGYSGVQLCMCNQQFALSRHAQDISAAHYKVFGNANLISMKLIYCWNTIANLINNIGSVTDIWGLIWRVIIWPIIQSILNSVCQMVIADVRAAISYLKSLVCIPIPHFSLNLNLGHAGSTTCNGVSLLGGFGASAIRPQTPTIWGFWGMQAPIPYISP